MTVKEYISSLLSGLTIPEAFFADMDVDLTQEYSPSLNIGPSIVSAMEGLIFAPHVKSVNENGFSMQWDMGTLGKYYLWLCKKYGIKPNSDLLPLLGMNVITDISDTW